MSNKKNYTNKYVNNVTNINLKNISFIQILL